MKTVGIIGGFGPESTAKFQLAIVDLCAAQKQRTRPPILMWNTPIPMKIEEDLILKGKSADKFLPFLLSAAKRLETAGSDFLVLPCNTLHVFINEIRSAVSIPVLNIVDETAISLKENRVDKIGLIGTKLTIKSNMHTNKLRSLGIDTILPSKKVQKRIDMIIHNILNQKNIVKTKKELENIATTFKARDIDHILLACTDLQLCFKNIPGITIHDTMKVLAQAAVREIIGDNH
ncbi:amino acid racemase [Patescibacteria group bacterium]|nr:amino acid racemase [Patescibacteria group bacterium]MBU2460230.1 amino acid racemase [Patescibacteria group bacterium]MBU2544565.1 amino acid racemase [Patescibacteria group bacterium]